jgi:preprotein translocase SecF subunit
VIGSLALSLFPFKPPCGGLDCGIDFKGGTVMEISTRPRRSTSASVRGALDTWHSATSRCRPSAPVLGHGRFQTPDGATQRHRPAVQAKITETSAGQVRPHRRRRPKVSDELLHQGPAGLGGAILLMLIYIWFRFELQFGLGAVAALFHDVFLTFGLIAVLRIEFDLTAVAAILTIIGYSMNDTVVVFDRFRENLRKYKRMPLAR